jgi:hypothetical protein
MLRSCRDIVWRTFKRFDRAAEALWLAAERHVRWATRMRRLANLSLATLGCVVGLAAFAGDWVPDSSRQYHFSVKSPENAELSEADRRWAASLVANLRNHGSSVSDSQVLPRVRGASLTLNGEPANYRVYRASDRVFLALSGAEGLPFLIDLEQDSVRLPPLAGTPSVHRHPSGRFVVVLSSSGSARLGGIPVLGDRRNPRFAENEVSWH